MDAYLKNQLEVVKRQIRKHEISDHQDHVLESFVFSCDYCQEHLEKELNIKFVNGFKGDFRECSIVYESFNNNLHIIPGYDPINKNELFFGIPLDANEDHWDREVVKLWEKIKLTM